MQRLILLFPALLGALLASSVTPAQGGADGPWRDLESRIQYGYYTEDTAALRQLAEAAAAGDTPDKLRGYFGGLLAWRQALLAARSTASAAAAIRFTQRCVSELDGALTLQADFAEALALRAACLAEPLESGAASAPLASYRARRDIDRALQLAAHNPRVMLLDAMSDYELPPAKGGNRERALSKLRQTVAAFEAERGGTEPLPGWGAAEAWLLLGRDLLDHGDLVGARDALEHALLIAPEYAEARRLMAKVTSG